MRTRFVRWFLASALLGFVEWWGLYASRKPHGEAQLSRPSPHLQARSDQPQASPGAQLRASFLLGQRNARNIPRYILQGCA